jgi:hypothetical protein
MPQCEICQHDNPDKLQAKCKHNTWLCKDCVKDYPYAIDICAECDGIKIEKKEEKKVEKKNEVSAPAPLLA